VERITTASKVMARANTQAAMSSARMLSSHHKKIHVGQSANVKKGSSRNKVMTRVNTQVAGAIHKLVEQTGFQSMGYT
jgi:hypothetical protein